MTGAVPVVAREPEEPLMAHTHPTQRVQRKGWGALQEGSAGPFDPDAAKARVAAVPDDLKAEIAARYNATMKERP